MWSLELELASPLRGRHTLMTDMPRQMHLTKKKGYPLTFARSGSEETLPKSMGKNPAFGIFHCSKPGCAPSTDFMIASGVDASAEVCREGIGGGNSMA